MKKIYPYSLIMAFAFTVASCLGPANTAELAAVDSLQQQLKQAAAALKKIDHEKAEEKAEAIEKNTRFIQVNVERAGDTLGFKTAVLLTDYRALAAPFEAVAKNHTSLLAALDSTSRNLDNLRIDLKNNNLAEGLTPANCVAHEREQINQLSGYVKSMQTQLLQATVNLDTLFPRVKTFMEELSAKTGNSIPAYSPEKSAEQEEK